ncbi:hypothetical protein MMC30_005424 [Trapelia coarctata]|nr:hypothetical protein [Trapelia coarctata]
MSHNGKGGQNTQRGHGRGTGSSNGRGSGDSGNNNRGGSNNRGGTSGGGNACNVCGQSGHYAHKCPNKGRGGGHGGGRGSGQSEGYSGGKGGPATGAGDHGSSIPAPNMQLRAPDTTVSNKEDAAVAKIMAELSMKEKKAEQIKLPRRPAYGTEGTEVVVRANYFQIDPVDDLELFRYTVITMPEEKQSRRRRRFIEILIETSDYLQALGTANVATDWKSLIITTKKLDLGPDNRREGKILFKEVGQGATPHQRAQSTPLPKNHPLVTVQSSGSFRVKELMDYLAAPNGQVRNERKEDIIQAMNIVMSRWPSVAAGIVAHKSGNKFFPLVPEPEQLSGGLVAMNGYYSSVRTSIQRLLLNVNSITSAFYRSGPLLSVMRGYRDLHGNDLRKLQRFLKGVRVKLTHLEPPKERVIFGFASREGDGVLGANSEEARFDWQKDENKSETIRVTVKQFYKEHYKRNLDVPLAPVINVGNAAHPILVPPEVCEVLPGQVSSSKLLGKQTEKMVEAACREPIVNQNLINGEGLRVMGLNQPRGPLSFGLRIAPNMITVRARILSSPRIVYSDGGAGSMFAGSWNLSTPERRHKDTNQLLSPASHHKFLRPTKLANWSYVQLRFGSTNPLANGLLEKLIAGLETELRAVGMTVAAPISLNQGNHSMPIVGGYESFIKKLFNYIAQERFVRFLFVLLPQENAALYNTIKKIADTDLGLHTVCMVAEKKPVRDANMGYLANIALKVNMKLGGTNHQLGTTNLSFIEQGKTMIIGIDVTHPSPKSPDSSPSIAACVASVDKFCAQWLGSVRQQNKARKEMVDALEEMVEERLEWWRRSVNGVRQALPENILVYRDGVSEGQYQTVLDEEVPCIKRVINRLYKSGNKTAKVSVVVCGKRHHTRFYATSETSRSSEWKRSRNENTRNGLVVDRGVTSERYWDFYLQAHEGIKGTVRPGHYVVIQDEIGLKAGELQKITHNLCYMWTRATKPVSLCPPAYYADILCTRARCYINDDDDGASAASGGATPQGIPLVHKDVKNTMFFV